MDQNVLGETKLNISIGYFQMFVELDELYTGEDDFIWKERARWIKFEEDLEEGSNRWGKPHVASLSFHSLLELRRCLEQGKSRWFTRWPSSPAVACWTSDHWGTGSSPLGGMFHH